MSIEKLAKYKTELQQTLEAIGMCNVYLKLKGNCSRWKARLEIILRVVPLKP